MKKVIILGGCGAVGSNAVKTLASNDTFSKVVIGDFNIEKAEKLASKSGETVSAIKVDATDRQSLKQAITGCDLVVNCVGPFYSTVKTILETVMEAGINYVDVCDDPDVTLELLAMDQKAKDAGISALIGMGASPGITNLLAKLASDDFLDETDSVDIFHTHGGEPVEGEGVIGHRFHCMSIDIPMFLEGKLHYVKYFEEDGIALRQTFDFPVIGDNIPLYPYPHPEQLTLPRYINLKQVTNKGSVLPIEYYQLTSELCKSGLGSLEPVDVKGQKVVPYDFAVAFLKSEREKLLKQHKLTRQCGAMSIVVKGIKNGKYMEYRMHTISQKQALGEGTGIPAAVGAILMQQGKINKKGIFPPEAGVNPWDFIALIRPLMGVKEKSSDSTGDSSVIIEQIDDQGKKTTLDI